MTIFAMQNLKLGFVALYPVILSIFCVSLEDTNQYNKFEICK